MELKNSDVCFSCSFIPLKGQFVIFVAREKKCSCSKKKFIWLDVLILYTAPLNGSALTDVLKLQLLL